MLILARAEKLQRVMNEIAKDKEQQRWKCSSQNSIVFSCECQMTCQVLSVVKTLPWLQQTADIALGEASST